MVKTGRRYKIIILVFMLSAIAMAQSGKQPKVLVNVPIVSDKVVKKTEPIRVVTKDEFQRIINEFELKLHDAIKRIELLEARGR